jgi:hypothetical protein
MSAPFPCSPRVRLPQNPALAPWPPEAAVGHKTARRCGCGAGALAPTASDVPLPNLAGMAGFARPSVSAARLTGPRALAISALRMGGSNVPRVPYKAPGEQGYQVPAPGHHARACLFCPRGACGAGCTRGPFPDV